MKWFDVNSAHVKKQRETKTVGGRREEPWETVPPPERHSPHQSPFYKTHLGKKHLYVSFDWRGTKPTLSEVRYQTLLQIEGSDFKRFRSHKLLLSAHWKGFYGSAVTVSLVTVSVHLKLVPVRGTEESFHPLHGFVLVLLTLRLHWHIILFFFFFLSQSQPEEMCLPCSGKNILAKWPSPKTRSGVCIDCVHKHNMQF